MLTTPRAGGKPTRETASDNVLVLVGAVTENQSPPCGSLVLSGPDCKPDQRNPSHLGSANPEGQVHIMADVWSVFDYEVQMFNGLLALCQGNIRNSFQWPIPNAITESLLLHARILTCVLISRGREDDIKLSTLLPGFTVPGDQHPRQRSTGRTTTQRASATPSTSGWRTRPRCGPEPRGTTTRGTCWLCSLTSTTSWAKSSRRDRAEVRVAKWVGELRQGFSRRPHPCT